MPLNRKQEVFCNEYIIDLNGTQAAIRAGYSEKTAEVKASQLLRIVKVKDRVSELQKTRSIRTEVTQDLVINEISKIAFANIQDIFDEYGELIPIHELPREVAAALQEINQDSIGNGDGEQVIKRKYKLSDKKSSLELLGRHLGLFTDKIKHDHLSSDNSMSPTKQNRTIEEVETELIKRGIDPKSVLLDE